MSALHDCSECQGRVLVAKFTNGVEMPDRHENGCLRVCKGAKDANRFLVDAYGYCVLLGLADVAVDVQEVVCIEKDDLIVNGGFPPVAPKMVDVCGKMRRMIKETMNL